MTIRVWFVNLAIFHARTINIEIDYHFAREKVDHKTLQVHYVPSKQQLADYMTKTLPAQISTPIFQAHSPYHAYMTLRGDDKKSDCN